MYIRLSLKGIVDEIIPDEDPVFPGISIDKRYPKDFVESLLYFSDDTEVKQHWVYDNEQMTFSEPPKPVPPVIDENIEPEPEPVSYEISTADLDAAYQEGVNSVE